MYKLESSLAVSAKDALQPNDPTPWCSSSLALILVVGLYQDAHCGSACKGRWKKLKAIPRHWAKGDNSSNGLCIKIIKHHVDFWGTGVLQKNEYDSFI